MARDYEAEVKYFMNAVKDKDFYIFDTETTGLNPKSCDIIEFSAIRVHEVQDGFRETGALDIFINPGVPVPEEVTTLTGITTETVQNGLFPANAVQKIAEFWGEAPFVAGYNSISFDQPFLEMLYHKSGTGRTFTPRAHLDILKMARDKSVAPYKLQEQARIAGTADKYRFHRSIEDVMATFDVFKYLLPKYIKDGEEALNIAGFRHWKIGSLDRIYVENTAKIDFYYDLNTKKWACMNASKLEEWVREARAVSKTRTDEEFVQKYG